MEPINGAGNIAHGAVAAVTPPVGEVWAITNLAGSIRADGWYFTTNGATPGGSAGATFMTLAGASANHGMRHAPAGPLVVSNALPLKISNQTGSASGYNYSGVKL